MAQGLPAAFVAGPDDRNPFRHHPRATAEHAALVQSRETGDSLPDDGLAEGKVKALPFAKSWVHMMAGGCVSLMTRFLAPSLTFLSVRQ